MTGMKPNDAIGLKEVPLVNQEKKTHFLRMDCTVTCCSLVKNTTRATDRTWSKKTCRLSKVTSSPSN